MMSDVDDYPRNGVLLFGKKGNDFVFKIGDKHTPPVMLPAEEALSLFEAERSEKPVPLTKDFDAVYQRVKSSLFAKETRPGRDKDLLNAVAKVKVLMKKGVLPKDYLCDLITVITSDALSGYEIRLVNQLTVSEAASLPQLISPAYLARIVAAQNKGGDPEELLIMSEELQ